MTQTMALTLGSFHSLRVIGKIASSRTMQIRRHSSASSAMKRLHMQDALRILRGLEALLNYLPAIFVLGHLVRSCTWAGRSDGSTGIVATCALQRCVECKEQVA